MGKVEPGGIGSVVDKAIDDQERGRVLDNRGQVSLFAGDRCREQGYAGKV
jgi:hypothetical protein